MPVGSRSKILPKRVLSTQTTSRPCVCPTTPSTTDRAMASSKSVPDYVTLISCDGFEYHVPRSAAISSGLIRRMLDPSSASPCASVHSQKLTVRLQHRQLRRVTHKPLHLREYHVRPLSGLSSWKGTNAGHSAVVLEVVCEYLLFNEKYRNEKNVPEFDLPKELCLELVLAADYLNV